MRESASGSADAASHPSFVWNVIVFAHGDERAERETLDVLSALGDFRRTRYADVWLGHVAAMPAFLERLLRAAQDGQPWMRCVSRLVPVSEQFDFTPRSLNDRLQLAAVAIQRAAHAGTFQTRAEWRDSPADTQISAIEDVVNRAFESARRANGGLTRTFSDPDYIVAVEIVGDTCGVGLVDRDMRDRYAFVRVT